MWKPQVLLAKKPANPRKPEMQETLVGHTRCVCDCARVLADMLGGALQKSLRCQWLHIEWWKAAVIIACWIHDWGKATDHFHRMLSEPAFVQGVRHEAVSLMVAKVLEEWLKPLWSNAPRWVYSATLFAVGGHHLKFPDPTEYKRTGTQVVVFLGHPDFTALLSQEGVGLGLAPPPPLEDKTLSLLRKGDLRNGLLLLQRELDIDFEPEEKAFAASVKAAVMAADLAGSALPTKVDSSTDWMRERLQKVLSIQELEQVVWQRLRDSKPRQFQVEISETASNTTVVEAGCGSGKTAGAYLWASRHAHGKRLFFCYPTTGTASEGFAGYLRDPDFDAILVHSRAAADYRLLDNMPDPRHEESELRSARLEALETWPMPAVVCTAHTVLGMMENVRRGLYAWPSIIQSAFVFDEVHAFSERLFSYLLRFLTTFRGAPVLLMTATLPPGRRQALEEAARHRGGIQFVQGPQRREHALRYRVFKVTMDETWGQVRECLLDGGKVLWVHNTVDRAMRTCAEALRLDLPVEPYHSRFRYKDRLVRQRTVIDGFARNMPPMLAVTTQVAEMSLDLSADLLVSEWAPVAAMIQRLGRLNRFDDEPLSCGAGLFVDPENLLPYDEEEMFGAREWLDHLADGEPKSQVDLAETFVRVLSKLENRVFPAPRCEWLDGLWSSLKDVRTVEEAGHTVDVVREEDLLTGEPNDELAIPMPFPKEWDLRTWSRAGRYVVAPRGTIAYDTVRGAQWNTKTQ